jgi:NAD-dependent deacetylase
MRAGEARGIEAGRYRKIVVLTGAGISAGSGIRTYRGPDGIWEDEALVRFSNIRTFQEEPLAVWKFWWETRRACLAAAPNAAHLALARVEAGLGPGQGFLLITQNIDGLHGRAGSRNLVEFHGRVLMTRCSNRRCALEPFPDPRVAGETVPVCPLCGAPLRPDIVMFGEMIPEENARRAEEGLRGCDLFVAIGTSGTVQPAASFVDRAAREGARTVYINLESLAGEAGGEGFGEEHLGRAEVLVPRLLGGAGRDRAGGA